MKNNTHKATEEKNGIEGIYDCSTTRKGTKEDTTWITLSDGTKKIEAFCEFPWKLKGKMQIKGEWIKKEDKTYLNIISIHPAK
jgi:hypothetical protein